MPIKNSSTKAKKSVKKTVVTKEKKTVVKNIQSVKKPMQRSAVSAVDTKEKSKKVVKTKLNKKDLDFFKKLLFELRFKIIDDIKHMKSDASEATGDSNRDISGHTQHMADVATDMYDKEFSLGLAAKDQELLIKIDDALNRIEDGTYGICLGTYEPISKERLKAIPYAEYCLKYQEEIESKDARSR